VHTLATIASIGSSIAGILPANWDNIPQFDAAEGAAAINPWREALTALEADASAPLPTDLSAVAAPGASSPGFLGGSSGEEASHAGNGRAT
jgi:hypothetical protein